jgi:hypothetical protein
LLRDHIIASISATTPYTKHVSTRTLHSIAHRHNGTGVQMMAIMTCHCSLRGAGLPVISSVTPSSSAHSTAPCGRHTHDRVPEIMLHVKTHHSWHIFTLHDQCYIVVVISSLAVECWTCICILKYMYRTLSNQCIVYGKKTANKLVRACSVEPVVSEWQSGALGMQGMPITPHTALTTDATAYGDE